MRITKRQLRRIIKEEIATVTDDAIEDVVMSVLSDEGGAAGAEPIEDALEDLEDEEISLPDEDIEDIIGGVTGVKRHADGDYIDTTQLESRRMRITKRQLRRIIKESLQRESTAYEGPGAKGPMTQDYLMQALSNTVTFGANKGKTRGDVVMAKIAQGRHHEAANAVMDALWIDDVSLEAEDELAQILKSPSTLEQVALAAADWGTKHFRMR